MLLMALNHHAYNFGQAITELVDIPNPNTQMVIFLQQNNTFLVSSI